MEISNIVSSYYISGILEENDLAASGDEQGNYPDLFAAMLALMVNSEGTKNMTLNQDNELKVKTEELSQNSVCNSDEIFGNCLELPEAPELIDIDAINSGISKAGRSEHEIRLPDLTPLLKASLQETGNNEHTLLDHPGLRTGLFKFTDDLNVTNHIKGLTGIISDDQTEGVNSLNDLLQGIKNHKDSLFVTSIGSQSSKEPANAAKPELHLDDRAILELVKELSGEIKTGTNSSGQGNVTQNLLEFSSNDMFQGSNNNKESTFDIFENENVYQFVQGDNAPEILFKETATINSFSINQNTGLDSAKIWAKVTDLLKQVPLSTNEANMVKEIEIKLHPAELGKLEVQMKMEDGLLHLVINASDQATGTYLQNYLGELRQSLTQIGISCGSMEMGFQGEGEQEQEKGRETPQDHKFYGTGEEESFEYSKIMYYQQDLKMHTKINVSV
ncbi:MAG: flagellar hook-length control protein FliK [Bacillota bacterium]|jgi:flagellar hook-length control protein FliK